MGCGESQAVQTASAPPPAAPPTPSAPSATSNSNKKQLNVQVPAGAYGGSRIRMKTPEGAVVEITVPAGVVPGQVFTVQYVVNAGTGTPQVIDEEKNNEEKNTNGLHIDLRSLPAHWTNVKVPGNSAVFDQMVYIDRKQHHCFDELLRDTYVAKATRDRQCPKRNNPCPKTAGGCPCVQPDAGLPTGYVVRRVVRVEDSPMYTRYVQKRHSIKKKRQAEMPLRTLDPPAKTDEVADRNAQVFEALDADLNEVYLWHGTNVRAALSIAANDFRVDLAGSNVGTMYGRGAYLAESCTKADEYAIDEPGGYYENVFALLLCRVCLGSFYYTEQRDEQAGEKVKSGNFDSTVGDRLKSANTFREFVVYDSDAVYPEYIVIYNRAQGNFSTSRNALARVPFHLQLPVYWSNSYKDPSKVIFNDQFMVVKHTRQLVQALAQACFKGEVHVKSVKRIENSNIWNSYVSFKKKLSTELGDESRAFKPVHELDGKNILTHTHLRGMDVEEAISIGNIEERLNECLLWHGTSPEAAAQIVVKDFHIPEGKEMKSAARFGNGAYFAEDLGQSLRRSSDGNEGKVVLLCRVLCGDFYYTEEHTQIDAGQKRDAARKHSVLANPDKRGIREYIVPSAAQVYPEFVIELDVPGWVAPPEDAVKKTKIQVTIPAGFKGSQMQVKTPDGREVTVMLPKNAQPGATLEMQV